MALATGSVRSALLKCIITFSVNSSNSGWIFPFTASNCFFLLCNSSNPFSFKSASMEANWLYPNLTGANCFSNFANLIVNCIMNYLKILILIVLVELANTKYIFREKLVAVLFLGFFYQSNVMTYNTTNSILIKIWLTFSWKSYFITFFNFFF